MDENSCRSCIGRSKSLRRECADDARENITAAALGKTGVARFAYEKLSAACPESELCCISVPPVTSDTSYDTIHNSDVVDFNAHIQSLCSKMGLRYFDIFTLLCDSAGNFSHSYAAADGMHFQSATYDVMLSYIQNELS